jgi:diacylglycerol kinase (ATP)
MSFRKRANSFYYAGRGLADLVRTQPNARIHLVLAAAGVGLGFYVGLSRIEWMAIAGCIAAVFATEAVNTAIEYLTDLVSPDYHPLAGKAKDVAAGAVLVVAAGAVVIGALIFAPKLF